MKKISPSDTLFLDLDTPMTPMCIGGVALIDPSSAPEHIDLKAYIANRLHLSPNLRRKLVFHPLDLDDPRIVDDPNFNIDDHVHFETLSSPNDWATLRARVEEIIAEPVDMNRPLWDFYFIDGLTAIEGLPENAIAFVNKFHHSIFDGGSTGATLWQFMQDAPGETVAPPAKPWQPAKEPDMYDWMTSSMVENTKLWGQSMSAMQGFSSGVMAAMNRPKENKPKAPKQDLTAPPMRFSQALTSTRTWDTLSLPMAELQALRAALGKPKMNDLLMAIISGGIRRYLQKTNELPEKSLLSICPISVRENNPLEGGNFLSAMRVSLFTDIENPIERLAAITQSAASSKDTVQVLGKDFAAHVLGATPYLTRKNLIGGMHALLNKIDAGVPPLANVVISNAPPPKGGHYFADCRVITSAAFGPVFNYTGVIHAITGMDFESTIAVTACKDLLPDIEFYMSCIRDSYDEMSAAANLTGATVKESATTEQDSEANTKVSQETVKADSKPKAKRQTTARKATAKKAADNN